MTRFLKGAQRQRSSAARRSGALARAELREPSVPRQSSDSATSFPVKARDPELVDAIAAFMASKGTK